MGKRKNQLTRFNTLSSSNTGVNLTSSVTDIRFLDDIGYQFTWSGTASGAVQVQVSADHDQDYLGNIINAGNWIPLTLSYFNGSTNTTATSIPTTVGSPIYIDLALLSAPWIRSAFIASSSTNTGLMTATITAKEI